MDAAAAIDEGLARARQHEAAQIRVQLCATALRAQAELAALARARRNGDALRGWLDRARELIANRAPRRRRCLADHAERGGLAGPRRGRVRARRRGRPARVVVGGRSGLGAPRAPAARGLLPLAPGRGARRRRRAPRRGERAAQRRIRRRSPDRSAAPAERARAACRARAARSRRHRRQTYTTRRKASKSPSGSRRARQKC